MFYYKIKDDRIIKYEIKLDIDKLKKLRIQIINNCSLITHKHYETINRPDRFDYYHIRNYFEEKIRTIEYEDFYYSTSLDQYLVDYDYYEHPELVSLIDSLLIGNTNVIEKIKTTTDIIVDEEEQILKEQQKIISRLAKFDNKNIQKQLESLNNNQEKLANYLKQKKLNKNQVSVKNYIDKTLECIHYTEISSISIKTFLEVKEFFYDVNNNNNELSKILKLEKGKHN